jgi:hypothetical protein
VFSPIAGGTGGARDHGLDDIRHDEDLGPSSQISSVGEALRITAAVAALVVLVDGVAMISAGSLADHPRSP